MLLGFHGKLLLTLTRETRKNYGRNAEQHSPAFCAETLLQSKHKEGRAQDTAQE